MLYRRADSTGTAERMTNHVGLLNLQVVQQRGDVVAHCGEGHRPPVLRSTTMALQLHRDHLTSFREWTYPPLHLTDRRQASVDQHEGLA
jgi:hypothetical protein